MGIKLSQEECSIMSELELSDFEEVATAFSEKSGIKVTARNYFDWLFAGSTYSKFDRAVKKFIGKEVYREMEILAREDAYLMYKLGLGPNNSGGIVFR